MPEAPAKPSRPFLQGPLPIAFGHRGGSKLWPENTMAAFEGAVGLGCRYLETDVRLTRDGVLVTIHDETLERTTNGSGPVSACSLAELKQLDAGYHFSPDAGQSFPFRAQGLTIATLAEVAEAFPDVRLNVDMKQHEPVMVEAFARFIEEHGLSDRVLAASFDDRLIAEFRRRTSGRIATAGASGESRRFWLTSRLGLTRLLRVDYDALQVPPTTVRLPVVDRRLVAAAHRLGVQVHVWTVDEAQEMHRLLDVGVDGIMSDRPDILVEVLKSRRP